MFMWVYSSSSPDKTPRPLACSYNSPQNPDLREPTMSATFRTRLCSLLVVMAVIPVGLFARSMRADADPGTFTGFLATYTGDTLWPVMFYFIGRFIWPRLGFRWLLAGVLMLTLTLEFGQLWQPTWLQWLRRQPVSGFLLGNTFLWSDVVCCLVGSLLAVLLDWATENILRRRVDASAAPTSSDA